MAKHDSLISVEKRILLHLLNHYSPKHRYKAPIDLTQIGIAHAVGHKPEPHLRFHQKVGGQGPCSRAYMAGDAWEEEIKMLSAHR